MSLIESFKYFVETVRGETWDQGLLELQDDSDGNGPYIATWPGAWGVEPTVAEVLNYETQAAEACAWACLRSDRNALLTASDWTVLPDSPLSLSDQADAMTYRAALRDLPANTVDPSSPSWPAKPAFL